MKRKILIALLIVVGVAVVVFFGMRMARSFRRMAGGPPPAGQTDVELIRGWMTIPYVARSYGVPDRLIFQSLKIPEKGNEKTSIADLNQKYYPGQSGYVLEQVKVIVQTHLPPPPPFAPDTPSAPSP